MAYPEGYVLPLEQVEGSGIESEVGYNNGWIIDHAIHPNLLLVVGKQLNLIVDAVTLEVAAGRWVLEGHSLGKDYGYYLDEE